MKQPTVSDCYSMIRLLNKRAEKGDAAKIDALKKIIDEQREKQAVLQLEKYFSK